MKRARAGVECNSVASVDGHYYYSTGPNPKHLLPPRTAWFPLDLVRYRIWAFAITHAFFMSIPMLTLLVLAVRHVVSTAEGMKTLQRR